MGTIISHATPDGLTPARMIRPGRWHRPGSPGDEVTERDPYAVLGVPVNADVDAIAAAYRDKARRHHPDVSADAEADRRMAEINDAWATLRDPERRAAWDRAHLRIQPRRPGRPSSSPYARAAPASPSARPRPGAPGMTGRPAGAPGTGPAEPVTWRVGPNGEGAAGPPPGPRQGSVLPFGRHIGWSLGEIARADLGYLKWLRDRPEGTPYRAEIDRLVAARASSQARTPQPAEAPRKRKGIFG
jgi:curved DNA-binding protein CbpA